MLEVQIQNIVPVTEARDRLNQLVDQVENSDNMYVMTKNGRPSAILVGVHHLESLTGEKHEELFGNNNKSNTEESMDMNTQPVQGDDAAAAPADAQQAPATDTAAPAGGVPPVVSDSQSAMAGVDAQSPAQAQPFAPAEPTVEPPVEAPAVAPTEPAPADVMPSAPADVAPAAPTAPAAAPETPVDDSQPTAPAA